MRSAIRLAIAATLATVGLVALPGSAGAIDQNLGAANKGTQICGGGFVFWNLTGSDTVPAGGGIVTSLLAHSTSTSGDVAIKVIRRSTVIATTADLTIPPSGEVRVDNLAIPVEEGDALGEWSSAGWNCAYASSSAITGSSTAIANPGVGDSITTGAGGTGFTFAVGAVLQPDADHDGFGDLTQDACPSDATKQVGPCTADLAVTASALSTTVGVGDLTVLNVGVHNNAAGQASTATLSLAPSTGLAVVSTSLPCTVAATTTCALGKVAGGTSSSVLVVLRGTAIGPATVTASVSGDQTDPMGANDAATVSLAVVKRVTVQCVVPKLVGLTKANAVKALKAKGCAPGAVTATTLKSKHGKVVAQAKKPGTKLPYGTKVGFRVAV